MLKDTVETVSGLLNNRMKWAEILRRFEGLRDMLDVLTVIHKYQSSSKDGVSIGFDDDHTMRQDMRELSARLLWVGVVLGRLKGLDNIAVANVKAMEEDLFLTGKREKQTDSLARSAAKLVVTSVNSLDELKQALPVVEFVYNTGWKFVDVLKRCIDNAREDNARVSREE